MPSDQEIKAAEKLIYQYKEIIDIFADYARKLDKFENELNLLKSNVVSLVKETEKIQKLYERIAVLENTSHIDDGTKKELKDITKEIAVLSTQIKDIENTINKLEQSMTTEIKDTKLKLGLLEQKLAQYPAQEKLYEAQRMLEQLTNNKYNELQKEVIILKERLTTQEASIKTLQEEIKAQKYITFKNKKNWWVALGQLTGSGSVFYMIIQHIISKYLG